MKMLRQLLFMHAPAQLKVVSKQESSPTQERSPYLKAILSGNTRIASSQNENTNANPDRDAALRYIRESRMLKRV